MYDKVTMRVGADVGTVRLRVGAQTAAMRMRVDGGALAARDAESAKRLAVPREIALAGSAHGAALFDGTEDVRIYTAVETLTNEDLEALLK